MSSEAPLSPELASLFRPGEGAGRVLGVPLPAGRAVMSSETDLGRPVYWLSDEPPAAGLWAALRRSHADSGLWPLLLGGADYDACAPWADGEVFPEEDADPGAHDPQVLMAQWWRAYTQPEDGDDALAPEERLAVTAPFGDRWPGLAPSPPALADPESLADQEADRLLSGIPAMRLGLVAAGRGADALSVTGWSGPVNYCDTAPIAAVVRSWEERFGVRVLGIDGHATLFLSVAAPPATIDQALAVAAEHFAFCPDNIWQGSKPYTLEAYAERLIGEHTWVFWWD